MTTFLLLPVSVLLLLPWVSSFKCRFFKRLFVRPVVAEQDCCFVRSEQGGERTNSFKVALFLATLFNIHVPLQNNPVSLATGAEVGFNKRERINTQSNLGESSFHVETIRVPYGHENFPMKNYLGKATLVINMKLDDPQTSTQFPALKEIFEKYSNDGLNVLVFPSEQGYYEPDDDETCRTKAKQYYGFGDYPNAVVFDKVDVLGPSANPLFTYLTSKLATPNGYARITLNYEKFLLDSNGSPLRRYPRKVNICFISSHFVPSWVFLLILHFRIWDVSTLFTTWKRTSRLYSTDVISLWKGKILIYFSKNGKNRKGKPLNRSTLSVTITTTTCLPNLCTDINLARMPL